MVIQDKLKECLEFHLGKLELFNKPLQFNKRLFK